MTMKTSRLAGLALLSALLAVSATAFAADAAKLPPLQPSDYELIENGKPFDPTSGKIEVVEFFNYICPACNAFDPAFQAWKAKLPPDVHVVYVPADFSEQFAIYARVYYAAQLLGLAEKTHVAVYKAIHEDHTLPGEGERVDPQRIAKFYAQYGTTAEAFSDAMDSFAVNTRMNIGHKYEMLCHLESTPTLVVNGKYRVKGNRGDFLRIADQLIERERGAGNKAGGK